MTNWGSLRTKIINGCLIASVASCFGFAEPSSRWQRIWNGVREIQAKKIYQDKRKNGDFWILVNNALYRIDPDNITRLALNKSVFEILQNPSNLDEIYAVTEDGVELYEGDAAWRNVLLRHDCRSMVFAGEDLIVATNEGLKIRKAQSGQWTPLGGRLSHQPFTRLASYGQVVYAATPNALYRYDAATDSYKEIFSTGLTREEQIEEMPVDEEGVPLFQEIRDVDAPDLGEVYVSTRRGIYHTQNDGMTWELLPVAGLSASSISALEVDADRRAVWAATEDGVFELQENRWIKKYRGLPTNEINDLVLDDGGNVYISTNRGFFIYSTDKALNGYGHIKTFSKMFGQYQDVEEHFKNEPTVREVQSMAVEYADVHPDKIKRWHRQSRLKALVPSLNAGIDRSATDLMHWDTGPNPDVLSKGRDFLEWDVGLSWDLGDMVWSSNQTSIDSRSKLMVELREEILDQVTRIYFERRRLQMVLLSDEHEADLVEEEMRLAELTAILDSYTGGQFSKSIEAKG